MIGVICPVRSEEFTELEKQLIQKQLGQLQSTFEYTAIDVLSALKKYVFSKDIQGALAVPIKKWLKSRDEIIEHINADRDYFEGEAVPTYLNAYYSLVVALLDVSSLPDSDDLFTGKSVSICEIILNADCVLVPNNNIASEMDLCYLPMSPVMLAAEYEKRYREKHYDRSGDSHLNELKNIEFLDKAIREVSFIHTTVHRRVINDRLFLLELNNKDSINMIRGVAEKNQYSRVRIPPIRFVEKTVTELKRMAKKHAGKDGEDFKAEVSIVGDVFQNELDEYIAQLDRQLMRDDYFSRLAGEKAGVISINIYYSGFPDEFDSKVSYISINRKGSLDFSYNTDVTKLFESDYKNKLIFIIDILSLYKNGTSTEETDNLPTYLAAFKSYKSPIPSFNKLISEDDFDKGIEFFNCAIKRLSALAGQRVLERQIYSKSLNSTAFRKLKKCAEEKQAVLYLYLSKREVLESVELKYENLCRSELYDGMYVTALRMASPKIYTVFDSQQKAKDLANEYLSTPAAPLSVTISLWQILKSLQSEIFRKINGVNDPTEYVDIFQNVLIEIDYGMIGSESPELKFNIVCNGSELKEYGEAKVESIAKPVITHIADSVLGKNGVSNRLRFSYCLALSMAVFCRALNVSDILFYYMLSNEKPRKILFSKLEAAGNKASGAEETSINWLSDADARGKWIVENYNLAYKQQIDKAYFSALIETADAGIFAPIDATRFNELLRKQLLMKDNEIPARRKEDWSYISLACKQLGYTDSLLYFNAVG